MTQPAVADTAASMAPRGRLLQLCAAGSLAYCSYAMCRSPLLPLFARELGADARLIGLIVGASTLTGVAMKLPAGAWSDVLGRRALLVAGAVVFAVMPFTYLAVSGVGLLIALRAVHGSATAIFGPVASASLSDIAPAHRRATWLSTYSTIQGAGQAIGPVLAGYLISVGRFDLVFLLAGVIAIGTPLIVWVWPAGPAGPKGPALRTSRLGPRPPCRQFSDGIQEVVRERRVLVASLAQAAQFLLNGSLNAFLPLYASEVIGMGAAAVGWLFAMQTVTTLATRPVIGVVSDRVGRRGVIVIGLVACSAAVWVLSAAESVGVLVAAVLAYAAGVAVTTAATSAYVTDVAPRTRYGAAHGVFGTIYDVGDAAGPILAGLLVAAWGYAPMFQVMAAVALAVACAFYVFSRTADETTA
jgi:DHA1 family multidrug resistance protein-like MFS transporter